MFDIKIKDAYRWRFRGGKTKCLISLYRGNFWFGGEKFAELRVCHLWKFKKSYVRLCYDFKLILYNIFDTFENNS